MYQGPTARDAADQLCIIDGTFEEKKLASMLPEHNGQSKTPWPQFTNDNTLDAELAHTIADASIFGAPCRAVPCHTVLWHAMLCHAVPCHAVLWHAMPCCAVRFTLSLCTANLEPAQ